MSTFSPAMFSPFYELFFGVLSNSKAGGPRVLLSLPLTKNLQPVSGTPPVTWTHTTGYILQDHTGEHVLCAAGEAGVEGGRRVQNLLRFSEVFNTSVWIRTSTTVTANAVVAPDGSMTADKIIAGAGHNSSTAYTHQNINITGAAVISIYAKAAGYAFVRLDTGNFVNGRYAIFNLTNGSVTTAPTASGTTASSVSVGDGWYRLQLTTNGITAAFSCLVCPQTAGTGDGAAQNGVDGVYIWGAQIEHGNTASEYISNDALLAPFHGANVNGVKWFDTNVTGTALTTIKGVATDRATTNKCTGYNLQPDAVFTGLTKTGDAAATMTRTVQLTEVVAAKYGQRNTAGYLITIDNTTGATNSVITIGGTVANLNKHSFSIWIMGGTGSLSLTGGVGSVAFGSSASLVKRSAENITPLAITDQLQLIVSAGQVVRFFAWQLTETAYAARIIENTAGTATSTTSATGTLPVAGNLGLAEGTVYCEVTPIALGSLIDSSGIIFGNADARRFMYLTAGVMSMYDGATAFTVGSELIGNTPYKIACSYSTELSLMVLSVNGVSAQRAYNGSFSATDLLQLGTGVAGPQPFPGSIKNIVTYNTYKTAAELNGMTV